MLPPVSPATYGVRPSAERRFQISNSPEKVEAPQTEEKAFHLRERLGTSFERRFTLPVEADLDTTRASFLNGLLEIRIRKTGHPTPRKVAIGS